MAKSRNRKLADLIVTAGVDIAGNVTFDGGSTSADLTFADGDKANFGASSDLQVYHDGSNSYIKESGSGALVLQSAGPAIVLEKTDGENMLLANVDGAITLYYNGSEKLATTSTGINVTGITTSDTLVLEGTGVNTTYFTGGDASVSGRQLTLSSEAAGGQNNATHRLTVPSGYGSFNVTVNGKERVKINNNGDISFYNDASSNAVKMFWDASTERLGIGTSTPQHELVVASTGNTTLGLVGSGYDDAIAIRFGGGDLSNALGDGNSGAAIISQQAVAGGQAKGDLRFQINTGDQLDTAMFISNVGNVGIGTAAPDTNLHVYKASAGSITASSDAQLVVENSGVAAINLLSGTSSHGQILFGDSGDADDGQFGYDQTNREFYFKTAGNSTKRLLIDSSGNLLVGKTAASSATVGFQAGQDGFVAATRANAQPLVLNRTTSDGTILDVRKDGTTIGSIASDSGAHLVVKGAGNNAALLFNHASSRIEPYSNGVTDLGRTYARFKDVWVSNGIQGSSTMYWSLPHTSGGALRLEFGNYNNTARRTVQFYKDNVEPLAAYTDLISLGQSTNRFKNLYLSGTVNATQLDITAGTDAKIYTSNAIGEVGSGVFAIQSVNSAGSALKPLGFRAEDIRFATGSAERLRIDSAGVVRIGGQTGTLKLGNDATYYADIEWEYNNNELAFTTNNVGNFTFNSNGTERMRIDSSGNVGIGTSSLSDLLTIQSPASGGGNGITIKRNDNGTDQRVGAISFGNTVDSDLAQIIVQTSTGNNGDGNLLFHTQINAGTSLEKMRLQSDGILHITSGATAIVPTIKHSGATGQLAKLRVINRNGQGANKGGLLELGGVTNDEVTRSDVFASVAGLKLNSNSNVRTGYLQFSVSDGSTLQERARITDDGRFGLGTTSPADAIGISVPSGATKGIYFQDSGTTNYGTILQYIEQTNLFQIKQEENGVQTGILTIKRADGNVGIGTDSPLSNLHIIGNVGVEGLNKLQYFVPASATGIGTSVPAQHWIGRIDSAGYHMTTNEGGFAGVAGTLGIAGKGGIAFATSSNTAAYASGRMIITAAGNVGIGTTSPGSKFTVDTAPNGVVPVAHIKQTGATNGPTLLIEQTGNGGNSNVNQGLLIRVDGQNSGLGNIIRAIGTNSNLGADIEALTVKGSGKVGIGTSAPTSKLSIQSGISSSSTGVIDILQNTNGAQKQAASIGILVDNGGESTNAAGMFFQTASGGSLSERMRIGSNGKVGIGTTAPVEKLEVNGNISFSGSASIQPNGTNTNLTIGTSSSGSTGLLKLISTGDIQLFQYGSSWTTNVTFKGDGNVGIGTTAPSKKLHVSMGGTVVTGSAYDAIIIQNSDAVQLRIVDAGDAGGNGGHAGLGNDNGNLNIASAGVMTFSTALTANEALYGGGSGTGGDERMRIDSDGNVGIGTAGVANPDVTSVGVSLQTVGPIISGRGQGPGLVTSNASKAHNIKDWFVYSGTSNNSSGSYVHMKTDLWAGGSPNGNTEYTMSCFTYHGYYAYGGSTTPGGYIGWHNWQGTLYNVHLVNEGTLALVQNSYTSSDGYVVLVALIGAAYAQFSIDWNQWAGYPFRTAKVTATTQTTSATGAY